MTHQHDTVLVATPSTICHIARPLGAPTVVIDVDSMYKYHFLFPPKQLFILINHSASSPDHFSPNNQHNLPHSTKPTSTAKMKTAAVITTLLALSTAAPVAQPQPQDLSALTSQIESLVSQAASLGVPITDTVNSEASQIESQLESALGIEKRALPLGLGSLISQLTGLAGSLIAQLQAGLTTPAAGAAASQISQISAIASGLGAAQTAAAGSAAGAVSSLAAGLGAQASSAAAGAVGSAVPAVSGIAAQVTGVASQVTAVAGGATAALPTVALPTV